METLTTDLLIVGAGPAGASLACFLASHGQSQIFERNAKLYLEISQAVLGSSCLRLREQQTARGLTSQTQQHSVSRIQLVVDPPDA